MNFYRNKKFLLIDNNLQSVSLTRSVISSFGVKHIDGCNSGEKAIRKMTEVDYDVIISEYDLGEGKNGQQVLEEAQHLHLIHKSAIYMIATNEKELSMVLGALENQPDCYLTKPYKKADLKSRLDDIVCTKAVFSEVNKALDRNEKNQAVVNCLQIIKLHPKYKLKVFKLLAGLFLDLGKYQESKEICDRFLAKRVVPWALLTKAKACLALREFENTENILADLIAHYPKCLDAYDILSDSKRKQGFERQAQEALEQASKISPNSILRQVQLGEIAFNVNNMKVAVCAFKKTVDLSRYSCHRRPSNYIYLAKGMLYQMESSNNLKSKREGLDVLNVINEMRKHYTDSPALEIKSNLVKREAYQKLGRAEDEHKAVMAALSIYDELEGVVPPGVSKELAETLIEIGEKQKGKAILEQLETSKLVDQADVMREINDINEDSPLNQKGMHFYNIGNIEEAIKHFDAAVNDSKKMCYSFIMNTLQARIQYMEKNGYSEEHWLQSKYYINRMKGMDIADQRYSRYRDLVRLFNNISVEAGQQAEAA